MRLAVLYQALEPPVINGMRKVRKPGGYSDSGADIAFALLKAGVNVLTPQRAEPATAMSYVFPDTAEGVRQAVAAGADTLWANTVLFKGHPIEQVMHTTRIVGQLPALVERWDDKFSTNRFLAEKGLPVAQSALADDAIDAAWLAARGLSFPIVIKPVRGRGSQGVLVVRTLDEANRHIAELFASEFGRPVIVEEFLNGAEITLSVLTEAGAQRALRPVVRFNHADGVAPYNGTVAVTRNSRALSLEDSRTPALQAASDACVEAAQLVRSRCLVRIDCRADRDGVYKLFDLNMKPNITGHGRPGRDDQDSLTTIAASAEGWSYTELLQRLLATAWTETSHPAAA